MNKKNSLMMSYLMDVLQEKLGSLRSNDAEIARVTGDLLMFMRIVAEAPVNTKEGGYEYEGIEMSSSRFKYLLASTIDALCASLVSRSTN